MEKLADSITKKIQSNTNTFTDIQILKIRFGLECLFSEASKLITYLIIFSLLSLTKEYFIAVAFFCTIRAFAGGYHADTYWSCFFTSLFIFTFIIYGGVFLKLTIYLKLVIIIISCIVTYIFAPVDHPNKPIISAKRRKRLKYISVFMSTILGSISLILPMTLSNIAVFSILAQSLALIMGYLKKRRNINEEANGICD